MTPLACWRSAELLLRDADKLDKGVRDRVEAVEGDQRDADVVRRTTAGADAL